MSRTSRFIKTLAVFLSVLLCFETMYIGVYGATVINRSNSSENDETENEYTKDIYIYSGTHSYDCGRAGNFSFDDHTLEPEVTFDAIGIQSNVFPVNITFAYNAKGDKFLSDECNITDDIYGHGWLPNYINYITEINYSDTTYLFKYSGSDFELFERTEDITSDEATAFPNMEKWISKDEISDTVIWKTPADSLASPVNGVLPTQYTAVISETEKQSFDSMGRLTMTENPAANVSCVVEYASAVNAPFEQITKITDGIGNEFRFSYSGGKLSKIKCYDMNGSPVIAGDGSAAKPLEVNFSYTDDELTGFSFPDEKSISFSYDNSGNLTGITDIDLSRLEIQYDDGIISQVTEKVFDAAANEYIISDSLSVLAESDSIHTFTDNYGHSQIKTFDEDGNILTIKDENNNYLYGSPEEDGGDDTELATPTDAATPTDGEYDFECLCPCSDCTDIYCSCTCASEDDCTCIQCKRQTCNEYDIFGNITAQKSFDGSKTMAELTSYTANGARTASSTDSSGNTVYYTYSGAGFLNEIEAGNTDAVMTYDAVGNLLSFSQDVTGLSSGAAMSNTYTYDNDRISSISHNGFTYDFEYDIWGNKTKVKIDSTVLTENTYGTGEHRDRLSQISFANGQSICYTYNTDDNITGVSYDGGNSFRYRYTYDDDGVMTGYTDSETGLTTTYKEDGIEVRRTNGDVLVYSTSENDDCETVTNVFGYTATYSTESDYNSLTGVTTNTAELYKLFTVEENSSLDADISLDTEMTVDTDWFGRTVSKNLSNSIDNGTATTTLTASQSLTYDDTETTASTRVTSHNFSLSGAAGNTDITEYYEYDPQGNISGIYRLDDNVKTYYYRYYYDEAGQIIREDNRPTEKTITYRYDAGGNITDIDTYTYTEGSLDGLTPTGSRDFGYSLNGWKDILTSAGNDTILSDEMGNITQGVNGDRLTWTAGRLLTGVDTPANDYECLYDESGKLQQFRIYDGEGEFHGGLEYFWEGDKLLGYAMTDCTSDALGYGVRLVYDASDECLGFMLNDSEMYFYGKDYLGDITGIYSSTGELIVNYYYDAFGNISVDVPEGATTGQTLSNTVRAMITMLYSPLAYRGYLFTPLMGNNYYYCGSRFYCSSLCRFMNADVYEDTGTGVVGTNMFAYCNNNPISLTDKTGQAVDLHFDNLVSTIIVSTAVVLLLNHMRVSPKYQAILFQANTIGELYYLTAVIYNGKYRGKTSIEKSLVSNTTIAVCKSFLNKDICKVIEHYYTWAVVPHQALRIAKEIFFHAVFYYAYSKVKSYIPIDNKILEEYYSRSDPINLGGDDNMRLRCFNIVWSLPDSLIKIIR